MLAESQKEILRVRSEMTEEQKREIISKDEEIATLTSQNE